uniref:Uncharacterized protein n=1 Tax=Romanomermis culicivorax TaxID=13658 RepID=A0A915KY90_ROMCU
MLAKLKNLLAMFAKITVAGKPNALDKGKYPQLDEFQPHRQGSSDFAQILLFQHDNDQHNYWLI